MSVHNHGPEEGKGLSCPEYKTSAGLKGWCILNDPATYKLPCGGDKCMNNPCCEDKLIPKNG